MSKITNLISKINNENILSARKSFRFPAIKDGAKLCRSLYKEGVIESFFVENTFLYIVLNKNVEKKKIVKEVFHKKLKLNLNCKQIAKLKNSLFPFLITNDYGIHTGSRLKEIKKGGIVKYKIL